MEKKPFEPIFKLSLGLRLLIYAVTLLFAVLSLVAVISGYFNEVAEYIFYGIAGVGMFLSCYYLVFDVRYIYGKIKLWIDNDKLASRVSRDFEFRTALAASFSLILNIAFAAFNIYMGYKTESVWFNALAIYYLLLSFIRLGILLKSRSISKRETAENRERAEWKIYRLCGIILCAMALPLAVIVLMMVFVGRSNEYGEIMIFVVATYTFINISAAIVNMVRAARTQEPVVVSLRNIGHADSLVSLLSLQGALLSQFSVSGEENMAAAFNSMTGIAVTAALLAIGVSMLVKAKKHID